DHCYLDDIPSANAEIRNIFLYLSASEEGRNIKFLLPNTFTKVVSFVMKKYKQINRASYLVIIGDEKTDISRKTQLMKETRHGGIEEVKAAVTKMLNGLTAEDYQGCFDRRSSDGSVVYS
ncbi:unnamed protein product, partial [Acanthoscelides obtectus]